MKTLLIFSLFFSILFESSLGLSKERTKESVTGSSDGSHHPYTECTFAILDARRKASELCYQKGGSGGWTYARFGECKENWLDDGQSVKMTFFCED